MWWLCSGRLLPGRAAKRANRLTGASGSLVNGGISSGGGRAAETEHIGDSGGGSGRAKRDRRQGLRTSSTT